MRVLLDECVPRRLQPYIVGHECQTAVKAGFAGKKNGALLSLAERAGYDVLLTVDRSVSFQQKLQGRHMAVLVIHAKSNKLADLLPHTEACMKALKSIQSGEVVHVGDANHPARD